MSMAQQRMGMRRSSGELDSFVWLFPFVGLVGGGIIGIPGIGLYVGLCVAALAINAIGTNSMTTQATLGTLAMTIAHPFGPSMRTGANGKWWPPNQLAAWWSALVAVFLTIVPFVVHDVTPSLKYFPHHLIVPGLAIVSFIGYFFSIHAISVAKRGERPPVLIEHAILKEKSASVASATIVGASMGIIAYIAIGHASTIRALLTTGRNCIFTGPDAYAGLGRGGAIGVSVVVALILAFAMASIAYKKAWLEPHMARVAALENGKAHGLLPWAIWLLRYSFPKRKRPKMPQRCVRRYSRYRPVAQSRVMRPRPTSSLLLWAWRSCPLRRM